MKINALVLLTLVFQTAFAQKKCGSSEYMQLQLSQQAGYFNKLKEIEKQTRQFESYSARLTHATTVTIPVVFHVVYNTGAHNISDAKLLEQLEVINEDFRKLNSGAATIPFVWQGVAADCEINFCLAKRDPDDMPTSGITRSSTNITVFGFDDKVKSTAQGGRDAWNTKKYINIWVCNLSTGLYGYTPFPGGDVAKDGIVLNYRVVGRPGLIAGADSGHTATHELGHYFNLRHIWADDMGCDSSDFVSDTPNQGNNSVGCPAFPQTDACSPNAPGKMFMNFMDYTDDACMSMFTNGQKARMWAMLDPNSGSRKELLTSNGCSLPVGISEQSKTPDIRISYLPEPGQYQILGRQTITRVECRNLYGEIVTHHYNKQSGRLDLQALPGGIYLISAFNEHNQSLCISRLIR